jgi:hypothetical protein
MCTIVTGLFDIKRHDMDGRVWDSYLSWFEKTLSLNCPMVVYVEEDTVEFVKNKRKNISTKIVSQKIEDLYYFKHKETMDKIIKSETYKNKIRDNKRIECNYSLYSIIQYSKFEWMKRTALENPFNSDYFIWMDAGLSRFFDDLDINKSYPSDNFKNQIEKIKQKVLIQTFMSHYPDLFNASVLSDQYLVDNRSYVMGGMFCGGKDALISVKEKIDNLFEHMLSNNIVNNEQIALGYLFKKTPELFISFINNSTHHRSYELINYLSL